ncbi:MAG TPA: glycosyltransferase [Bryobacteraceae bacterium]|nr:glycosyltransferase [Bryobacteraceae bacterium]
MRFVIFTHSLLSDWNHGNAHFLRGICTELRQRGHELTVYEPEDGWSRRNLLQNAGESAIHGFKQKYPELESILYNEETLDLRAALGGADVVLVHEWNTSELIRNIGQCRARNDFTLLFHDTHHRSVTERDAIAGFDLTHYDCVLAYGNVIRDAYLRNGWAKRAVTWHEAADTRIFHPLVAEKCGDLVWIGNWGDDERAAELREYLIRPAKDLKLSAVVYGVRYPNEVLTELADAGIEYKGWLPNYCVPEVFARYRLTIHVPRRPYVKALPGIPTIRPFEALACAIPLISAPWRDNEHLFHPDSDFVFAHSGSEMRDHIQRLLSQPETAHCQASNGLATIRSRHTCAHRVDELMEVIGQ